LDNTGSISIYELPNKGLAGLHDTADFTLKACRDVFALTLFFEEAVCKRAHFFVSGGRADLEPRL
jgi:hypothetical protein